MPRRDPPRPPRVFISYSHDSPEHSERVLALADHLRREGVDAWLDQYEPAPSQGWPRWMVHQLEAADFVLVVCTETYQRHFRAREEAGKGLGVTWEGAILTQHLYDDKTRNTRFIPVVFGSDSTEHIPVLLRGSAYYEVATKRGYEALYRRLTDQPGTPAPELGERRVLVPRKRRTDFFAIPEPSQADDRLRELSLALEGAQRTLEELTVVGEDTTAVRAEVLELKRRLRQGGQLRAGDFLADGRFRLIEALGCGGFATVWKAWDRLRCELVALKVLHGQFAEDRTRRERFFRGAHKMASLSHPGIVRVLEEEVLDEGYYFFAMEYVEGEDLRRAVVERHLSQEEALAVVLEVGEALQHAHEHGLVHRDVKPANVLLDAKSRPKLTDFDLVRAFDTTGGTRTAAHLGTFLYTAPEAMTNAKDAGFAADVYSLGMTLAFVLHGGELHVTALTNAGAFRASLPCSKAMQGVLARATAIESKHRYASVAELLVGLRGAAVGPSAVTGWQRVGGDAPSAEEGAQKRGWAPLAQEQPSEETQRATSEEDEPDEREDMLQSYERAAIEALAGDEELLERLRRWGVPWRGVLERLKEELPEVLSDRERIAHTLVPRAMTEALGEEGIGWVTERRPSKSRQGAMTTWIVMPSPEGEGA